MSDDAKLIDPSGIPHFIGDLGTLDTDVMLLTADAGQFRASGSDVHTEFQGLSAFYEAPEAEQLFATTLPVQQKSDAFADDLEKVATALSDYSFEVQPLAKKLDTLKADATAFVNSVSGDDDWRKDQDKVDHNNDLWHDVNHTVAAFQDAERTAYNKIMALIGGTRMGVDDGSGGKNKYGYRAEDLDHAESTPWGAPAEREYEGWAWLAHQGKQVWDGVWQDGVIGTIHGVGTLFGSDGWDAAGEAWKNLAKLSTASALTSVTMGAWWLQSEDKQPSWLRDSRKAYKETAKGFIAYDQWKTNPARAAGAVGFNVLTIVGTEGAGSAVSGAGKAGAAARTLSLAGKVGRAIDPMTYAGKAAKFAFVRVGDTFSTLKNLHTGAYADMADLGGRYAPAEHPVPVIERPAAVPESAVEYVDARGDVVYLTADGHVLDADGAMRQHVSHSRVEASAADRSRMDGAAREPEPVGSHAANNALESHASGGAGGGGAIPTRDVGSVGSLGHTGHGSGHGGGSAPDIPGQRGADQPPSGSDWYDSLNPREIKDVQIYRANHEPGYFEKYYQQNGHRLRVATPDESGFAPPQLTKDPGHQAWIAAGGKVSPIVEKYVPGSKVDHGPHSAHAGSDLDAIGRQALKRHGSLTADNAWHGPLKDAKAAWQDAPTPENLQAYQDLKAHHAPFHRAMSVDSEAFGEAVARHHVIPDNYPDAQMETLGGPKNGNDQFDQVWSWADEHGRRKFVVVEAKSTATTELGTRRLSTGEEARQGSKEYFYDILQKMKQRGVDGDANEKLLHRELKKAMVRGDVDYILVKGKVTPTGQYAGYLKWQFDIN
ncbi:protein phosphatase [Streptomyces sp. NBC_01601]|uniref:protein phosphatase n=1 Tax=Streptomyces sp. NBC_01601 TaxID=2975892 RepID=UPI002E284096|nr:protein phosphatase [Streptomyces sp. NBC_01601]